MKTIAVHSGQFHADEVFAVAILKLVFKEIEVTRTRNPNIYSKVDLRVDVGMRCDPKTGDFDHHQKEGAGERYNGIPYASAGLVWNEFGKKLVDTEEEWEIIDKKVIQPIDAGDNGYAYYETETIKPYVMNMFVESFCPSWDQESDYSKEFDYVVSVAVELLKSEINLAKGITKANGIVLEAIKEYKGKDYMIMNFYCPWKRVVREESEFKFVILKGRDNFWYVNTVSDGVSQYGVRKALPEEWGGLEGKELQEVSGVEDAIFCHKKLFIAGAKSKEGAISMVEKALKN
jgi:uncharacterized UPF0160 family protein